MPPRFAFFKSRCGPSGPVRGPVELKNRRHYTVLGLFWVMEKVVYTTTIQFMLKASGFLQNAPKFDRPSIAVSAVLCIVSLTGCHKTPPETARGVDLGDAQAASAKIAEADKLWVGREDLDKVRQAVAILRQARI